MTTAELSFREYRRRAARTARTVYARYPQHALDEQAGPAYLEGLAVSRWIFWRRLSAVLRHLPAEGDACLDFGCGFGLLLPMLKRRFRDVAGVDLMPELAAGFLEQWKADYGEDVTGVVLAADLKSAGLKPRSVDVVLALDVLEHVADLPQLLEALAGLLKPEGMLFVSGPTENWVYKLGRRVVGFSGDYHVRNIHDITREMERHFRVKVVRRLGYPLTLFDIVTAFPR